MRHLVVLFIHFIATLARLLGPGGVRSCFNGTRVARSLALCISAIPRSALRMKPTFVSERCSLLPKPTTAIW